MSDVDYTLHSTHEKESKWPQHEFYNSALVLGIDVGIEGMGVWLRKGKTSVFYQTYEVTLPEAAPLENRRQSRAARRCRKSRRHRDHQFRKFCEKYGLPTFPFHTANHDPFFLRLQAISEEKKLKSKEALVVCLRHIIRHRGYDYHLTGEGAYPWGDALDAASATQWAQSSACKPKYAEELKYEISDAGWSDEKRKKLFAALDEAVERYHKQPIRAALEKHFAEKKQNLRPPARKQNFPRELVEEHLETVCRKHSDFFGESVDFEKALHELKDILNYHRKKPGALAERKVKKCPFAETLELGSKIKCGKNEDVSIRRFKVLEFLASRTFVDSNQARTYASPQLIQKLLKFVEDDAENIKNKKPRQELRSLRKWFEESITPEKPEEPKKKKLPKIGLAKKESHNESFFNQLKDLLRPGLSVLKKRASMSIVTAEKLFVIATENGQTFVPEIIRENLSDYYQWRRNADRGYGIYPQVDFLMGPRNDKDTKAAHGVLKRIFTNPKVQPLLEEKTAPDYVVIEVIGDVPRNSSRKEGEKIKKEQKARRAFKEKLFEDLGPNTNETTRKRAILFEQQNGICPYTGQELDSPQNPDLHIDHVFPRERGGIGEMINLVLTHSRTNSHLKGKKTPIEAFGKEELTRHIAKMKWNKAKRELFLREESDCPNWQNTTRTAQLARHLRDEIALWLGIKGDATEMARRIGTPTGYMTSICRNSWKERVPKKNRHNLRHHMYDAAVISHIPPGAGLNKVRYGGIFYHEYEKQSGSIEMKALPELGPDIIAFEKEHKVECLVTKPRQSKSKKSRYDQTIYSLPDKEGDMWSRKSITESSSQKKDDSLIPVKKVEEWLKESGIDPELLPRKRVEEWLSHGTNEPLRLTNGTPVYRVPVKANKEQPSSLAAHRNKQGQIIGYKVATEGYLKCEIWQGQVKDRKGNLKTVYDRLLIPHPRNLRALKKRGGKFKPQFKNAFLRNLKKIGEIRKGDVLRVPINAKFKFCKRGEPAPHGYWWYRATALKTDGEVTMTLVEYKQPKIEKGKVTTHQNMLLNKIFQQRPSSNADLAYLLEVTHSHDPSPHPDQ